MLRDDSRVPRPPSHAFVGRSAELTELLGAFDAAATESDPSFTLVSGDAGSGKTRLLQELQSRVEAAGGLALVGSCVQVGDFGLPYLPIVDALRTVEADPTGAKVLRAESALRPALARLLPQLLDRSADEPEPGTAPLQDGLGQGQLFEALHRVLTTLGAARPVLLVIEDAHWADHSTRDLIAFLARTLRSGRVTVVVSYRTDDLHRRHPLRPLLAELARLPEVRRVALAPFSRTELAQLLDELTGSPVDVHLVDRVFARSEGNAFFAEELIRAGRNSNGAGRLPDQLTDVLLSRVEELDSAGRQAVRAAAVAGRRVGHGLLLAAADAPETEEGLRQAVEAGLLTTDGESYNFRHALFQEAVYGDLLPGERVRLHARFAELLAADTDAAGGPAELAHHLLAGHDLPAALGALIRAATAAETMAAPAEALRHLEQAVALLDRLGTGGDRLDLLLRAREAASASGDPARALSFGRAVMTLVDDRPEDVEARAGARERLAILQFEADVDDDEPSRVALELLDGRGPSPLLARVLATRGRVLIVRDRPAGVEMLAEATRIAHRTGADAIAADALITLNLLGRRGVLPTDEVPSLAQALAGTTGPDGVSVRLRALRFQAAQLMEDGDLMGARAAADEGVELSSAAGLSWSSYGLDLRLMDAWILEATGEWDEALAKSLVAVYAPTEPGRVLATAAVGILVGRGDPEGESLLARLRGTGDGYSELQLDLREIDLRLLQRRPVDALAVVERCRRRLDSDGWVTERLLLTTRHAQALADLAETARRDGTDPEELIAHSVSLVDEADARSVTPALAGAYGLSWLLRLRAESDRAAGTDTADQWAAVLAAARRAGRVPEQLYAGVRAARMFLQAGDRVRAADLLRTARKQALMLGASPVLSTIDEMVRRSRLRPGADQGVTASESPLTARESEVLGLVSTGLSNRQVGNALFISDKTASVHLSHIMSKLGATTRTEAVSIARQRGLLVD